MNSSISSIISSSINDMLNNIFSSIDNNVYSILDNFTFITSDILKDSYFSKLFGTSTSTGLLLIANSLTFGFLLYYAFKLLFSQLGITQAEHPSSFLFKLLICSICMNYSSFICEEIIYLVSLISGSIQEIGKLLLKQEISFSALILKLDSVIKYSSNEVDFFSLDGILHSIISIGFLNLIITYAVRYVLIKVFVCLSPFSILSLSNRNTSILFKSWFKSFISLLLVQVFVSIILLLIFSFNSFANDTVSKLILIASLFILIKANSYIREMLGGISTEAGIGISNLKSNLQGR